MLYIERQQAIVVYAIRERLALFFPSPVFTRIPIVGNYTQVCRTSIIFRPWTCTRVIHEYSLPVDRRGRFVRSADGGMTWASLHDPARGEGNYPLRGDPSEFVPLSFYARADGDRMARLGDD